MSLEHILLGLLRKPASGYDLRNEFERGAAHFWAAGLNQIYPTLQRMEEKRWLRSREKASQKGPPRRVYRRTAKGIRELESWLVSTPELGAQRLGYIGQLVFMGQLEDLDRTRKFIADLRDSFAEKLAVFEVPFSSDGPASALQLMRNAFTAEPTALPIVDFHYLLSMELGRRSLTEKVNSCDVLLEMIDQRLEAEANA